MSQETMDPNRLAKILRQALAIDTAHRQEFIDGIEDPFIKQRVNTLMRDDTQLTQFLIHTAAGSQYSPLDLQDLQPGDTIKHILIKKMIGQGGMGCVYLGYDEKLARPVAIKTIRPEYVKDRLTQQRFEQEALTLSKINHPSICQIHDLMEYENGKLLVLEFIHGHVLGSQQVNQNQVITYGLQIARALAAAHAEGVIHRDLKPDNIMIDQHGLVKVLDFGIAKSGQGVVLKQSNEDHAQVTQNSGLTRAGVQLGTLKYMSPEQLNGDPVGPASDVFALGVILYELLVGDSPYDLTDVAHLKQQVSHGDLGDLQKVPGVFRSLIGAMTELDPDSRPDAKAVHDRLLKIKAVPKVRRRKAITWAVVIGVLGLVGGFVFYQLHTQRLNDALVSTHEIRQLISDNEQNLRHLHMLPIHELTADLQAINQRHLSIADLIRQDERLNEVWKVRLLGESQRVVGEFDASLESLQSVWDMNHHDPELAALLAVAHADMYLNLMTNLPTKGQQSLFQREQYDVVKANHLNQALQFKALAQTPDLKFSPVFLAQQLYLEGDNQQALAALDLNAARKTGDYAAFMFAAKVHLANYHESRTADDFSVGLSHLQLALTALNESIELARSYPDSYRLRCDINMLLVQEQTIHSGTSDADEYENGIYLCEQTLQMLPNDVEVMGQLATFHRLYANWLRGRGQPSSEQLQVAVSWNEKILSQAPNADAYETQAIIFDELAGQAVSAGQNPKELIQQSLHNYQQVLRLDPEYITVTTGNMLYALSNQAEYLLSKGQVLDEVMLKTESLLAAEDRSIHSQKELFGSGYINLGRLYRLKAISAAAWSEDTMPWIERSLQAYQSNLDWSGEHPYSRSGMTRTNLLQAQISLQQGVSPESWLNDATAHNQIALKTRGPTSWLLLDRADLEQFRYQWLGVQDAASEAMQSAAEIDYLESIKLRSSATAHLQLARLYYLTMKRATSQTQRHQWFTASMAATEQSLALNPNSAKSLRLQSLLMEYAMQNLPEVGISTEQLKQKNAHWQAINPRVDLNL